MKKKRSRRLLKRRIKRLGIKKLSTKLLLYLIIPMLLVFIATGFLCIYIMKASTTQLVRQEVFNESNQISGRMQTLFSDLEELIRSGKNENIARKYVENLEDTADYRSSDNYRQLQNTLDSMLASRLDVVASAGFVDFRHQLAFSDSKNNWSVYDWDAKSRRWYEAMQIARNYTYISKLHDMLLFDGEREKFISIVSPVSDSQNSEVLGVFLISVSMEKIREMMENQTPGENGFNVLLDNTHKILYYPEEERIGQPISELVGGAEFNTIKKQHSEDDVFEIILNGKNMYANYSGIESTNWVVLFVVPKTEVTNRIREYVQPTVYIYVAGTAILLILFFIVSRTIVSPIREITETTKEIAKGNYRNKLKVKSSDEIGQLASAFNSTIITLRYRADYDELTGIYNSNTMYREAEAMLKQHPDNQYAIICMDVNHFKLVNDLLGWDKGDELLKHIAHVLTSRLPHDSIYARVRGDIFCICMRYEKRKQLIQTVTQLRTEVEGYYEDLDVAPFFGIYVVEDVETPVNLMCDWADMALKSIKGNMVQFYAFYNDQLRDTMINNKMIESEMYAALEEQQFFVMIQPKCDINTGKAIGAEALVRWQHPERGMIPPDAFIPVFEEDGFVLQLDEYVWEETCKALRRWLDKGYEVVPVSVNVSRLHIYDNALVDKLVGMVKKYNLPTGLLELELTESAFLGNVDDLYALMSRLKEAGFTLSMDDFGSGYSSLNMLKDAPFDVVKFDREFLNETVNSDKGKTILDSMISMVNRLNIKVLVEGVETEEQTKILLEAGCHIAQGYYYSRPIRMEEFEEFAFRKGNPHLVHA